MDVRAECDQSWQQLVRLAGEVYLEDIMSELDRQVKKQAQRRTITQGREASTGAQAQLTGSLPRIIMASQRYEGHKLGVAH